ncbi:MAG: DUF4390 domain-containing protein [Candidatus Eisenbacteria bacterium]|nr:DUF4390 domain-containing protein [Candidatus Eisenbacteria bacterium]
MQNLRTRTLNVKRSAYRAGAGTLLSLFLLAVLIPAEGRAFGMRFRELRADSAGLSVQLSLEGLYQPVKERLLKGLPATLKIDLELYRDRNHWFDSRLEEHTYVIKLDYDPWRREFILREGDGERRETDSLAVKRWLEAPDVRFPWNDAADSTDVFFLTGKATLKLLTADDIREVEDWLGGHLKRRRSPLSIPFGLLGILKDASGLGDESSRARSYSFRMRNGGEILRVRELDE